MRLAEQKKKKKKKKEYKRNQKFKCQQTQNGIFFYVLNKVRQYHDKRTLRPVYISNHGQEKQIIFNLKFFTDNFEMNKWMIKFSQFKHFDWKFLLLKIGLIKSQIKQFFLLLIKPGKGSFASILKWHDTLICHMNSIFSSAYIRAWCAAHVQTTTITHFISFNLISTDIVVIHYIEESIKR